MTRKRTGKTRARRSSPDSLSRVAVAEISDDLAVLCEVARNARAETQERDVLASTPKGGARTTDVGIGRLSGEAGVAQGGVERRPQHAGTRAKELSSRRDGNGRERDGGVVIEGWGSG